VKLNRVMGGLLVVSRRMPRPGGFGLSDDVGYSVQQKHTNVASYLVGKIIQC